jgi:hypothetical protein
MYITEEKAFEEFKKIVENQYISPALNKLVKRFVANHKGELGRKKKKEKKRKNLT